MATTSRPDEAPQFLSTDQAAARLNCHSTKLRRLRAKNEGPPCVRFGGSIQYRSDLLDGSSPLKGLQLRFPSVGSAPQAVPAETAPEQRPTEPIISEVMTGIVWCAHKGHGAGVWVGSVRAPGPVARQVFYALDHLGQSFGPSEIALVEERISQSLARATPGQIEEVRRIFRDAGVPELRPI